MTSEERLRELEEKYEGYTVYDNQGEKIGKVDDLFVDEADREEYIGVKMGFLGRKSTLIPTEVVRVNEADKRIEVSESKDHVKNAPSFDDDEDITPDYEAQIRSHFGLEDSESSGQRGTYGADTTRGDRTEGSRGTSAATGTAASADFSRGSSSGGDEGGTTGSSPVTRETEETETYEEGGRTKVRRRVVREETFEEDAEDR